MRSLFGGLAAVAIVLAAARGASAQTTVYQMYAPQTWGSVSAPMNYGFTARVPDYVAPYGYGPQNNAFSNAGLGAFVNGDYYQRGTPTPFTPGAFYGANPNGVVAPAAPVAAPVRTRPLGRLGNRRR